MNIRGRSWRVCCTGVLVFLSVISGMGWYQFSARKSWLAAVVLFVCLLGFAALSRSLHERIHAWAARRLGVPAEAVVLQSKCVLYLEPVAAAVYRKVLLAPLVLPFVLAAAGFLITPSLGLAAGSTVMLVSVHDLADWIMLAGRNGRVWYSAQGALRWEAS